MVGIGESTQPYCRHLRSSADRRRVAPGRRSESRAAIWRWRPVQTWSHNSEDGLAG